MKNNLKLMIACLLLSSFDLYAAENDNIQWSYSTGNVIPSSSSYAVTFNAGLHVTKPILTLDYGRLLVVAGATESLLKAKTIINGLTFGYRDFSAGVATELGNSVFIKPEVGYAYTTEYFDGGRTNENIIKGLYYSIGIGIKLPRDAVGILKYQPMRGKVGGFMWNYESSF